MNDLGHVWGATSPEYHPCIHEVYMLTNYCLFFSCNQFAIVEGLSQDFRRVEGKLSFLSYRGLVFHRDCHVGERKKGAKHLLLSRLSGPSSQEASREFHIQSHLTKVPAAKKLRTIALETFCCLEFGCQQLCNRPLPMGFS